MPFVSYAQNLEDVMLQRALKHVRKGFYIDVGANDPELESLTRAFYEQGWRGINVEPVKAEFDRLVAHRPGDINLQVAVGQAAGELPLYVFPGTGLTTLSRPFADRHAAAGRSFDERVIPVRTLAEICAEHAPPDIHFLSIDVEGAEREVLAGADFARFRPWIILAEATAPNTQVKNHYDWDPILVGADYRFVWFDGLNRFYVAAERAEQLISSFEAPPNIFDNFTSRRVIDVGRPVPRPLPPVLDVQEQVGVEERLRMAALCRDGDALPRVLGAGQVSTQADGTRVQTMHNGLKVEADGYYGAWMTDLIALCRGLHEPQEERIFHEVVSRLGPGGTMIELGGYWAFYSLWYLMSGADRRAIVVEPEPAHLAVGERNAALNGLGAEFLSGYVGNVVPALTSVTRYAATMPNRVNVPKLMAARGIDRLEILHCDTQGAELAVLEESRDLIRDGRIRWLFVSTHARQICGDPLMHQRCLALLRDAGCVIEADHDVHESFSGDGLIVARSGPPPAGWTPVELSRNRYGESLFRNPLYDVASLLRDVETAAAPTESREAEAIVRALYKVVLMRDVDPGALEIWTKKLLQTGDVVALATSLMRSREFGGKLFAFLQRYGIKAEPSLPAE